jgi:outer membrane protein TolC
VDLARRNLAFQMGQPVDEPIEPIPVREQELPSAEADDEAAAAQALEQRPDLAAIRTRIEQAEAGVRAAWAQMLPEVNLLAGAVYNKGSEFQREASYFVGAKASWNLWEWGATYYGIEEAEAKVRQATSGRAQLEQGVRLEVRKAQSDLRTAKRQLAVAKRAVVQADENLRIVQRRYEQNASASTDVLDAVTLRQRAKTNEANALHAAFRAAHALRRATGAPVAPGPRREGSEP